MGGLLLFQKAAGERRCSSPGDKTSDATFKMIFFFTA